MGDVVWGLTGVVIGAVVAVIIVILRRGSEKEFARHLDEETQKQKADELAATLEQIKTSFAALSREALSTNTDDFLKLAKTRFEQQSTQADETLENKKKLIDARVEQIDKKLTGLNSLIHQIEKQRTESQGMLKGQLQKATQATNHLSETTSELREALANPQRRGHWGERTADNVLRLAGFVEGVDYWKQKRLAGGTIPDFTFRLPDNQCVHMDVKFPLANYLKMLDAPDEATRNTCAAQFMKDVRNRIKEATTREYIDPAAGTLDYVLVFIPNEQVYGIIHEQDSNLLDDTLKNKVVLCSPLTLYAILAVIHRSVDNFRLEQSSKQILDLLSEFKKQWAKYVESMDRMGNRLDAAADEYKNLIGRRTRQLERQLDKIENLRATHEKDGTGKLPLHESASSARADTEE